MPSPNRVMARMTRIENIDPIEGADKIQSTRVGGWTVVIGKGDFEVGGYAVFFEVDSFLPSDDPRYEQFAKRGERKMLVNGVSRSGHVLRTARLRGVYSQGLLMKPQDVLPSSIPEHAYAQMYENKVDLTSLCGVCEYEPVLPVSGNMHIIRKYDSWVAPRTDAVRIQNVSEKVFNLVKKTNYLVSLKVDGTSITMLSDPRYQKIRLFSHNNELAIDDGFGEQVYKQADEQGIVKWLNEHPGITLQMEAVGPKINGNRLGLKALRLFIFSAWDTEACKYLDPYHYDNSALDPACTPELFINLDNFATTIDLIDYVDGLSGNVTARLDEGVVVHILGQWNCTSEEMRKIDLELGAQRQLKVISRRYLLKAKD